MNELDHIDVIEKTDSQLEAESRQAANIALVQIGAMLVQFAANTSDDRIQELSDLAMEKIKTSDAMDVMVSQFALMNSQSEHEPSRAQANSEFRNGFAQLLKDQREQKSQVNQQVLQLSALLIEKLQNGQRDSRTVGASDSKPITGERLSV